MKRIRPIRSVDTSTRVSALPVRYFDEFAESEDEGNRQYAKHWREYGFHRFTDYLRLRKETYAMAPDTVFECGSADGSVIRELLGMGIRARGCEASESILRSCDRETRRLIAHADSAETMRALPDSSFDCVYETTAQYLNPKCLKSFFRNIHRVVRNDLVIVLHTIEEDPKPHRFQVNLFSNAEWIERITDAGFVLGYINHPTETTAPFWFRKVG